MDEVVNDTDVETFTTKVGITSSSQHFKDIVTMERKKTLKIPPLRSQTIVCDSPPFLLKPYAMAVVVGWLIIQRTWRLAIVPASLVT